MNYHNKKFRPITVSENGAVSNDIVFHYIQNGNILTCEYEGGTIVKGHLMGTVDVKGNIDMRYHQINSAGELMTGVCKSTPILMENGKLKLIEAWQWTSGDCSAGNSVLIEI